MDLLNWVILHGSLSPLKERHLDLFQELMDDLLEVVEIVIAEPSFVSMLRKVQTLVIRDLPLVLAAPH